uniref:ShKT domain-containing protein n=1 Tax=Rhabditophanes sp. KR3021 TaxID=114890 RepID=A0AC35U410_9BILA
MNLLFTITFSLVFNSITGYENYFYDHAAAACVDTIADCATWVTLCNQNPPIPMMDGCKKTCNDCPVVTTLAPCNDVSSNCAALSLCANPLYKPLMIKNCKKFCNFCNLPDPTTVQPQTTTVSTVPCEDQVGGSGPNSCRGMVAYCTNPTYRPMMKKECPK